jgi:hypothetical protein
MNANGTCCMACERIAISCTHVIHATHLNALEAAEGVGGHRLALRRRCSGRSHTLLALRERARGDRCRCSANVRRS